MDTGLVSLKAASKNVGHKTGKFLGEKNRFAVAKLCNRKTVKKNPVINENTINIEELITTSEKREEIINQSVKYCKIGTL